MTRFTFVGISLIAGLLLLIPLCGHSQQTPDAFREFGYIALRDGVRLAYVAYVPTKNGRYPTLLEFSPYGVDAREAADAKPFVERGYAYIGVSIRGASCSQGELSMFDPRLADDGAEVISWIAGRQWSNGKVGMIGNSYPGHTQIFVASKRPKHLLAIAPGAVTASSYREVWRPAGMFNYNFIASWAFSDRRATAAEKRVQWGDKECDVVRAKGGFERTFYEVLENPLHDNWWKPRDLETYATAVQVPTLLVGAWQDPQTQVSGVFSIFEQISAEHKRLLIQPGGHFVYRRPFIMEEWLKWMDFWLKGVPNAADKEPPIKIFWEVRNVDGSETPNWITSHADWPPPNVVPFTLHLTHDGKLLSERPTNVFGDGARSYVYPAGTEWVGDNEQFAVKPNPLGVLSYRSEPVKQDVVLLGHSQLTFYLSSKQTDTDVMVVLHDIDPEGNTLYLQRAFIRGSLRSTKNVKTSERIVRPLDKSEPLVPDKIYEMNLSIPPLGHVLREGHALELMILAPSHVGQPNWGFMIVDQAGQNTVYHSDKYPSQLVLSVSPGEKAQAPAPPCGVMEFQPCRPAK